MRNFRLLRATFLLAVLVAVVLSWQWQSDLPLEALKGRWGGGASRFVDVDGMSVHYRDEGKGPLVLLLHGTGASLHTWDGWTATLVASGYRVVRADLPGFGLTGPSPRGDYRTAAYVAFIDSLVGKLGLDRFVLAGNSLGGLIAWRYAVAQPQHLRGLILVDAGGYPVKRPPPLAFRLGKVGLLRPLLTHLDPRWLVRTTLRRTYGDPTRVTEELVDRYTELSLRAGNREAFGQRSGLSYEDRTDELHGLKVPTLVMWGKKDNVVPLTMATRFAEDIPGAKLVVYDELGHVPMEEDPARSVADVQRFLEKLPQ